MAEPEKAVEGQSILNQPKKETVEPTPESKLFPETAEPKPAEPVKPAEPAKPAEPEPKKEEPKTEPKPSEPAKPAAIDYETLKLPAGSLLSNEQLSEIKKEAKEQGLTLEEAQGVIEVQNSAIKGFKDGQDKLVAQARKEWKEGWSKDPEFGGEKERESTLLAQRAWDRLADNELKTLANTTGFGDHPAVLRMMTRIGRLLSEDQLIRGNVDGGKDEKPPEEKLYGSTTKKS